MGDRETGERTDGGAGGSATTVDPESGVATGVAGTIADEPSQFLQLMGHHYRGEMSRKTAWRTRLDRTTNWAVVLAATLLTWAFSAPDRPHYIILGGLVMVTVFLGMEARRYRIFDVWRSRVRLLEENVLAPALAPDGVVHEDWREMLADDLRQPTVKVPMAEAIARRLRRVYLPLLGVLLASWVVRLVVFTPADWINAAAVGRLPGPVVVALVAGFTVGVVALAAWPMRRRAKGELEEDVAVATEWRDW